HDLIRQPAVLQSTNQRWHDGERSRKQPRSLRNQGPRAGAGASAAGSSGRSRFRREPGVYRRLIAPAIKKAAPGTKPGAAFLYPGSDPEYIWWVKMYRGSDPRGRSGVGG